MDIKKVAVIGAGTMGNGIAHVFAQHDFNVSLVDVKVEYLEKALATISKNLDRQIKKEILKESDKDKILSNIKTKIGIENIDNDTDLIIEAIVENKDLKLSIFEKLEQQIKPEAIFASNTSSISITESSASSNSSNSSNSSSNSANSSSLFESIPGAAAWEDLSGSSRSMITSNGEVPPSF